MLAGEEGRSLPGFLEKRLESLERELAAERERAQSAQALFRQQEALRGEVESALKGLSEQLRREKAERESAEEKTRAHGRIEALEKRLDDMHSAWASLLKETIAQRQAGETAAAASSARDQERQEEILQGLERALERLAPPQAKDEVIAALEGEKEDLLKALRARVDSLRRYAQERKQVEQTMGQSLMDANREIDQERQKARLLEARIPELELEAARLKDRLAAAERLSVDKDERLLRLSAEREELARALAAEGEKAREQIAQRSQSDQEWSRRVSELQELLSQERQARLSEAEALSELRSRMATLSEHLAKALQEKQAAEAGSSSWSQERERLLSSIREKDEMISMLTATFQKLMKPGS